MALTDEKHDVFRQITYFGPGLSGKLTNLQYIYSSTDSPKYDMVSIEAPDEFFTFFDFMPEMEVDGHHVRLRLITITGGVFWIDSWKELLENSDAFVFVADSQKERLEANIESLEILNKYLQEFGRGNDKLPIIIQYNKSDLPNALSVEELSEAINPNGFPEIKAMAINGDGVFETLELAAEKALNNFQESEKERDKYWLGRESYYKYKLQKVRGEEIRRELFQQELEKLGCIGIVLEAFGKIIDKLIWGKQ